MMAECHGGGGGDFLIKLFGKTIPVPESGDAKDLQQSSSSSSSTEQDQDAHAMENGHAPAHPDSSDEPSPQPEVVDAEDPKSSPPEAHHKPGDGNGDAASQSQREKLKKPDKVLPCPRCNSMDTKFCYFNNYNVNQPRHFCKNCQRYWTAGGAMRNVPVGAGRRKNKNAVAASHFLQRVRAALPACRGGDTLKTTNGTVLSFGGHGPGPVPACLELDLVEQLSHLAPARNDAGDAGPCCSEGSTNSNRNDNNKITKDKSSVDEAAAAANGDGSVQQHPASMNIGATLWPPYSCAPSPAAYFSSGIAIPIYPAAAAPGYWVPGAWSLPWPVQQPPSSSPTTTTTCAPSVSLSGAADSHTLGLGLGKHPRDREREGDDGRNGGNAKVWAPKTIRIDDVEEVARSSIWSLIGIKSDKTKQQQDADDDNAGGHGYKQRGMVFEPKREASKKQQAMMTSSSPILHANPVAFTRSVAFQEGS